MQQPGQAISSHAVEDGRVHPFINYLWEAFFLPRHLVVLSVGALLLAGGVLMLTIAEFSVPGEWGIPFLLGGAAVLEWRYLQRLSQEVVFVQTINAKYQKEIALFLELEEEMIPQQATPSSLDASVSDQEGKAL